MTFRINSNVIICSLLLFFSISTLELYSQAISVEDFSAKLDQAKRDTAKLRVYKENLRKLISTNLDTTIYFNQKFKGLVDEYSDIDGLGLYWQVKSIIAYYKGDLDSGLEYILNAQSVLKNSGFDKRIVSVQHNLGIFYLVKRNYEKAISIFRNNIEVGNRIGADRDVNSAYYQIGMVFKSWNQMDSAMCYFDKTIELAVEQRDSQLIAYGLSAKGYVYEYEGKVKEHMEVLETSLELYTATNNMNNVIYIYSEMGVVSKKLGFYKEALDYSYKALDLSDKVGSQKSKFQIYSNIGNIYQGLNLDNKAKEAFQKAYELAESQGYDEQLLALAGLISYYEKEADYEKAIQLTKQGITLAETHQLHVRKIDMQEDLLNIYLKTKELDKVKEILETFEYPNEEMSLKKAHYYDIKSRYFFEVENLKQAKKNGQMALDAYDKFGIIEGVSRSSLLLYSVAKKLNNNKEALQYYEAHISAKDSLLNEENIRRLTANEMNHAFDKEKEVLALEQEKEEVLLKAKAQQSRLTAGAVGLLALLGFGFFWNARRKNKIISQQNQQLEQLNITKDRIFAIIGHDLRKPAIAFRGITKKVNYLLKKKDFETLNTLGNEIEEDALGLNKLIDNLLNWALMQKNVLPHDPKEIYVKSIVEEVNDTFAKKAQEKNIDLSFNISSDLQVYADSNALQTVVRNLVDNALKYTPEGGRVVIEALEKDNETQIKVSDTGVGMPEEKIREIFLLKKEKSQDGTAGEKGTGLGMHLVNELVKLNEGTIKVISELNKGTTFELLLPKRAFT